MSIGMSRSAKEWSSPQNALAYLNVADNLPHRSEGESVLIDHLPENTKRVLDLGTGDGRLIKLIKANYPDIEAVALDVSPTMLKSAREHFAGDSSSVELHVRFLKAIGYTPEKEDKANRLLPMETQLGWLKDIGFVEVDCYWKWLEMALLIGYKA
jgi:ubiquinone/menaquinone biosynthesis C-methylase UbiE